MLDKIGILIGVSMSVLGLMTLSADAQTSQEGTQDAYIQGNNNEINQIINQYHFENPGKGTLKRKEPITGSNNSQQPSINRHERPMNSNNSEWGQNQGEQRRRAKN